MDQIVSAVSGWWALVIVAVVVVIVVIGCLRRRRRSRRRTHTSRWALVDQVDGTLGADRRRLADTGLLLQRSRRAGLAARLHVSGLPHDIPKAVDRAGYRIVEEALTSALEHGMAAATVAISYDTSRVTLTVDSPIGNRPTRYSGLSRMRERAGAIGGTVEAGPHRGGWRVTAQLPIDLRPS